MVMFIQCQRFTDKVDALTKPRPLTDIGLVILKILVFASGAALLAFWAFQFAKGSSSQPRFPLPEWVRPALLCFLIVSITGALFGSILHKTKRYKSDPHRFAQVQRRFLFLDQLMKGQIEAILRKLEYTDIQVTDEERYLEILARRQSFSNTTQFPVKDGPASQALEIYALDLGNCWAVVITCQPLSKFIIGGLGLTSHRCLEELILAIDAMNRLVSPDEFKIRVKNTQVAKT